MDTEALLDRARSGTLTVDDVDAVAEAFRGGRGNRYTLLHILGKADARQYRDLVESVLISPEDPMLSRLAVEVLCNFWQLAPEYRDAILAFVHGVAWDRDDDVRLVALTAAGEYLRTYRDVEFLRALYDAYKRHERRVVRETAYLALARAIGYAYDEIPSAGRHFDASVESRLKVIPAVERALGQPS